MNFSEITTLKQLEKEWEVLREEILKREVSFPKTDEAKEERLKKASGSVFDFAKIYFPEYFSDEEAPFHREWEKITKIFNKPILVEASRGFGKSTFFSFADILYGLLFKKSHFTLMVSYTDDKAKIFTGRILLELLYNPRIREDFKYRFIRKEIGNIQISLEGFKASVKSFSIGQNVRGEIFYSYRPDKARLDDIQDRKKAKSRKFVESAIEWILLDLLPAMNPKNYSCIISATPLNKKCVVSALKEGTESRKPVLSYSYPAIRDGHSTWPSRFTLKYLEEIKGNIGSLFFNQEYLLIPMPVDETVFREEWIRYYSKEDLKNFKPVMILTWTDPSLTSKGCYKATVCLASDGVYDYVLKARVKKESVSSMLGGIYQIHRQYHPLILFYEDYTDDPKNQTILQEAIDTKEKEAGYSLPLKPERNTLNKEMRIEGTLSSRIENGLVRFDRDDPDQKIIIDELLSFPESEYLDGADALEGAVRKMREFCLKYRGKITTRKSRYPSRILEGY